MTGMASADIFFRPGFYPAAAPLRHALHPLFLARAVCKGKIAGDMVHDHRLGREYITDGLLEYDVTGSAGPRHRVGDA
jgi:hypothetical protein